MSNKIISTSTSYRAELGALDKEITRFEKSMVRGRSAPTKEDVLMEKMRTEQMKREYEMATLEEKRTSEVEGINGMFMDDEE